MFCKKCGKKLSDNTVICPVCGEPTGMQPTPFPQPKPTGMMPPPYTPPKPMGMMPPYTPPQPPIHPDPATQVSYCRKCGAALPYGQTLCSNCQAGQLTGQNPKVITFMISLLLFYMKGEIRMEQNFIKTKLPNAILFIPFGTKRKSIPINQISSVNSNFSLNPKSFICGLVALIAAIICLGGSPAWGIILLLLAALYIIDSFTTMLVIEKTSGNVEEIPFYIMEKTKCENIEEMINQIISQRMYSTMQNNF